MTQHINPDELSKNSAFTNVVVVTGPLKTMYIGGQDAVDAAGRIVGKGDIRQQTERVLSNLQAALKADGAALEHVVKWNVYIVQGQPLAPAFEVFQRVWGRRPNPPAISLMFALDAQLDAITAEGWPARFARHKQLMQQVHNWVKDAGFDLFAEHGYRSPTVTCVTNTRGIDVSALNKFLRQRHMLISNGYGALKDKTFRIAHMGDATPGEVTTLLNAISDFLKQK